MVDEKKSLKGIGGWLLFILIIFILYAINNFFGIVVFILKPILVDSLVNITGFDLFEKIEPNLAVQIITAILEAVALIALLTTIILIIKKKEKAKKIALITLWILLAISIFASIVEFTLFPKTLDALQNSEVYPNELLGNLKPISYINLVVSLIFSIGWSVLWICYFMRSKRVKNTLIEA